MDACDLALSRLRTAMAGGLVMPICALTLQPNITAVREHKLRRIEASTKTILRLQAHKHAAVHALMRIVSFCGEEEFYLAFLPLLFWTQVCSFDLALHLTILVTLGFLLGNMLKDTFRLPRLDCNNGIWCEHISAEYGFPSTHAMNAVSNSLLLVRELVKQDHYSVYYCVIPAMMWVLLMSTSRMYLGMHTGTDIRGGIALGLVVFSGYFTLVVPALAAFWQALALFELILCSFSLAAILLLLCPQPPAQRPTPSFGQNGLILGILLGIIVGKKLVMEFALERLTESQAQQQHWSLLLAKCLFGFGALALIRIAVKAGSAWLIQRLFGSGNHINGAALRANAKTEDIFLLTRDWDLLAMAMVKVCTYFACALWIGIGCAFCWERALEQ